MLFKPDTRCHLLGVGVAGWVPCRAARTLAVGARQLPACQVLRAQRDNHAQGCGFFAREDSGPFCSLN